MYIANKYNATTAQDMWSSEPGEGAAMRPVTLCNSLPCCCTTELIQNIRAGVSTSCNQYVGVTWLQHAYILSCLGSQLLHAQIALTSNWW